MLSILGYFDGLSILYYAGGLIYDSILGSVSITVAYSSFLGLGFS